MAKKTTSQDRLSECLEAWRTAKANLAALLDLPSTDLLLERAQRKVDRLKLELNISCLEKEADFLMFTRDLEAGDPDAVGSDLQGLLDRIDAVTCSPDPESVQAAGRKIDGMIRDANAARDRYDARRKADGLPAADTFPTASWMQRPVEAIRERVAGQPRELRDWTGQIRMAEGEYRAQLLREAKAEREKAEAKARDDAEKRAYQERCAARARQEAADAAAEKRKEDARIVEENALILAYLESHPRANFSIH